MGEVINRTAYSLDFIRSQIESLQEFIAEITRVDGNLETISNALENNHLPKKDRERLTKLDRKMAVYILRQADTTLRITNRYLELATRYLDKAKAKEAKNDRY